MDFTPKDQADFGGMLLIGGIICFLVWLFLQFLWAIGLALVVAGGVLFLSGKAQSKHK